MPALRSLAILFAVAGLAGEEKDGERQTNVVILAAGASRPPPRPPAAAPRPPARINLREKTSEPTRPGHVPGRRLAGPPDAPYWEPVLEIPWRGGPLQGPKPTPPQRAPGEGAKTGPPSPRPQQQQPGQPPSTPPTRTQESGPRAAEGQRLLWGFWRDYPKVIVAGREYAEIGGRLYTQHAVERMLPSGLGAPAGALGAGRSVSPAFVEQAIATGTTSIHVVRGVTRTVYTSGGLQVVTEEAGRIVITIIPGVP